MKCCLFYIYYWKNELYTFLHLNYLYVQLQCNSRIGHHVNVLLLLLFTPTHFFLLSSITGTINMTCYVVCIAIS